MSIGVLAPDGSLVAADGRVIVFSKERFERDVCRGDCCFVCGVARNAKEFNDEHILPRWLLRKHDLFAREIMLPNGHSYRYDRYKVPCCAECNAFMGKHVEEPVRAVLSGGYEAVVKHLKLEGPSLLYRWLALIYIKTHLRDATLPWNKDRRNDVGQIGDVYDWIALHHIHAVARSIREGIELGPFVVGSFVALPALKLYGDEDFDFGDMYAARAVLVRTGGTALVAVLNDAMAAQRVFAPKLAKVNAKLTPPQLREILAHYAFINLHLTTRPTFSTVEVPGGLSIVAKTPSRAEFDWQAEPRLGKIMTSVCGPLLQGVPNDKREMIEKGLADGAWSWMFDGGGNFISNGDDD